MATNPSNNDAWVDARLRSLDLPSSWQPDVARGRAALAAARTTAPGLRKWPIVVGLVALGCVGLSAFPSTRLFAERCVSACVDQTARVTRYVQEGLFARRFDVAGSTLGDVAPDFSRTTATGATVTLSDLRGRVVLVNFWATWCAPCAREMPWFVELQNDYKDLAVIGVSLDEDGWDAVKPFLERLPVNYPVVLGDEDLRLAYGGVSALPTSFILDRSGRVVAIQTGLVEKQMYEAAIRTAIAK